MGGSRFDTILQEVKKQQLRLEQLQVDNRELRQQLADLRAGKGIFLEIHGKSIALNTQIDVAPSNSSRTTSPLRTAKSIVATPEVEVPGTPVQDLTTEASAEEQHEEQHTSEPAVEQVEESDKEKVPQLTFLEEMMLQEIESSLTGPMPANMVATAEQNAPVTEEHKANLRRELMGSYILE